MLVDLSRTELVERNYNVMKTTKEEKCLTEAIYYEAGNQSEIGKEAVALVVMNRAGSKHRPNTICGVVAQAHVIENRKVCQFSFWCENKYKPNKAKWEESQQIAHRVLTNYWKRDIISQYQTAVYFHADYVRPKWRKTKVFLGKIDNHLFYGEKP
jgi:spore germination cell wall hydrolase CwlJ-like protein